MLDMEQLIDHVPINKVVARVDLPEVIDEIDLAGVIRESTTGLGAESSTVAAPGSWPWTCGVPDWSTRSSGARNRVTCRSGGMSIAQPKSTKPEVIS